MISLALAERLRAAGLAWQPAAGDRFAIPHRGMDEDVFVLSDMTVEVHEFPTETVIGFNGTTEWALDSVEQAATVWLPAEHQLRERLGTAFVRLERAGGRWRVVVAGPDSRGGSRDGSAPRAERVEAVHEADDAADAYGQALLAALLRG